MNGSQLRDWHCLLNVRGNLKAGQPSGYHFARIEAGRWLVYRALDLLNRGQPALQEVTMAKLYTTELSQEVLYDCMQVYGGIGYLTECPIGRQWRDARLKTIGGGSSEVMKEILAKEKGIG